MRSLRNRILGEFNVHEDPFGADALPLPEVLAHLQHRTCESREDLHDLLMLLRAEGELPRRDPELTWQQNIDYEIQNAAMRFPEFVAFEDDGPLWPETSALAAHMSFAFGDVLARLMALSDFE